MVTLIAGILVGLFAISTLAAIYMIDKPRKPLTHSVVCWATIYNVLYSLAVIYLAVN